MLHNRCFSTHKMLVFHNVILRFSYSINFFDKECNRISLSNPVHQTLTSIWYYDVIYHTFFISPMFIPYAFHIHCDKQCMTCQRRWDHFYFLLSIIAFGIFIAFPPFSHIPFLSLLFVQPTIFPYTSKCALGSLWLLMTYFHNSHLYPRILQITLQLNHILALEEQYKIIFHWILMH